MSAAKQLCAKAVSVVSQTFAPKLLIYAWHTVQQTVFLWCVSLLFVDLIQSDYVCLSCACLLLRWCSLVGSLRAQMQYFDQCLSQVCVVFWAACSFDVDVFGQHQTNAWPFFSETVVFHCPLGLGWTVTKGGISSGSNKGWAWYWAGINSDKGWDQ